MNSPIDLKVWSLEAPCDTTGGNPHEIAGAISKAASLEGIILHQCDVVGIKHHPSVCGEFARQVQQAIHHNAGVAPQVMIYGNPEEQQSPLCALCALVGGQGRCTSNVVVIQGAAL